MAEKKKKPAGQTGLVIGAHGRHYIIEFPGGTLLHCYPRGKKSNLACGDHVEVRPTSDDQGVIDAILPRTSLLYRSDQHREKIIAANVTQVVIVIAAKPSFYEDLLTRCLVAADSQHARALIVLNKADLEAETAETAQRLQLYVALGYPLLRLSARLDISALLPELKGHTSVLVGQSGMGKSTIVNALVPEARAATGELSETLDSGTHTTTSAHLYHLDDDTHVIDSPGMQTFGLHHLSQGDLVHAFPEFRGLADECRFGNCKHTVEPGCAIIAAVEQGRIAKRRWDSYRTLTEELARRQPDWS